MPKKGYADVVEDPQEEERRLAKGREWAERMMDAKRKKRETQDPTKSVSQEERIGAGRQKLGEEDRQSIARQVREDEDALAAASGLKGVKPDLGAIKQRLERNKMILGHDEDLTPRTDSEKDRLYARLKEITGILQKEMPTKREMWPKTGSTEAQQAVRHNVRFQERYGALCHEYQELKKRLDPDDPYAQSLELIRPD